MMSVVLWGFWKEKEEGITTEGEGWGRSHGG